MGKFETIADTEKPSWVTLGLFLIKTILVQLNFCLGVSFPVKEKIRTAEVGKI